MERYVRSQGAWITDCGRFLFEPTRSGWRILDRFWHAAPSVTSNPVAESGILDYDARWSTRAAGLEALTAVCAAVGAPTPGRLRIEGGWSTADRMIRLSRVDGLWRTYLVGMPLGKAVSDRGFETREEATRWARARQRGEHSRPLASLDTTPVDAPLRALQRSE